MRYARTKKNVEQDVTQRLFMHTYVRESMNNAFREAKDTEEVCSMHSWTVSSSFAFGT